MKKLVMATLVGTSLAIGAASISDDAFANSRKTFTSSASLPAGNIKINVTLSEDLAYRADHVSKDIKYRSRTRGLRNGFVGHGLYGERDLAKLTARLKKKMEAQLTKKGIEVSDNATSVLNLVLTDVSSNRPTFKQLSASTSLSHRSFGIGGAEFTGTLVVDGEKSGEISYAWFESNIRDSAYGGTWTDANRAIDRFARKTAKSLR